MLDENAFGILISYFDIEDEEYGREREAFVDRYATFAALVRDYLTEKAPAPEVRALDLGFAFYVELGDGEQQADPIAWLREARRLLGEHGYATVGILSHGGRWVDEGDP